MGEPFSVVTGTAGFISLGLEVCKGLISYCRAWKSHDNEIEEDIARLSRLELTLKSVHDILLVIESIDDSTSETLHAARAHIRSCTAALNTLSWALIESEPISQPSGVLDKVHNVRIRSAHFFNKEKLKNLRSAVAASQSGLSSAIQMLNLHLAAQTGHALKLLAASSMDQANQIPNAVEAAVIRQFELYGHHYSTLREDVQDASSQQMQAMQHLKQSISTLQLGMTQKPSLVHSAYEEERRLRSSNTDSKSRTSRRCNCRPSSLHKPLSTSRWRRLYAVRKSGCLDAALFGNEVVHRRDCPLFGQVGVEKQFGMRLSYSGPLLAGVIQISMSMTRGSGGLSISPTLAFIPTVPYDAPAFMSMDLDLTKCTSAFDMETTFDYMKRELSGLYSDSKASPCDMDPDGNTVLHRACSLYSRGQRHHDWIGSLDSNTFYLYFKFLKSLYELGVPLNSTNAEGLTPLQVLVKMYSYWHPLSYHKRLLTLLNLKMIDIGAETLLDPQVTMKHSIFNAHTLIEEFAEFSDFAEALGCNEIMQAITTKSLSSLISAISRDPASVHQRNMIGQLPIHLCVDWPEGMRLLLDFGAAVDALDGSMDTAVTYAIARGRVDMIKILAEADCALCSVCTPSGCCRVSILEHVIRNETCGRWYGSLLNNPIPNDGAAAVVDAIISLVAQRRRTLTALARTSLDEISLEKLELSDENILDHKALLAVSMLSKKFRVPDSLKQSAFDCSVYDLKHLNWRQARSLWDAGFREIDEFDELGLSPLMKRELDKDLKLVEWLVSKGADLHRRQAHAFQARVLSDRAPFRTGEISHVTAAHYLAYSLGWSWSFKNTANQPPVLTKRFRKAVRMVLADPLPDRCVCACSTGGCHLYTVMVKSITLYTLGYHWGYHCSTQKVVVQCTEAVAYLLDIDEPRLAWLRREMLRFSIFVKLELRHTCCSQVYAEYGPGSPRTVIVEVGDEEERCEIREEQAETVQKLEELLIHFESKYEEMAIPFHNFLEGYWKDHMKEVLSKRDPIDVAKLESIGVIIHDTDYASSDASDDQERMEELDSDDSEVSDT